jgi:hypothetical protein
MRNVALLGVAEAVVLGLAVTGGTGSYRTAGGEGTLVEFGNGKGRLTLHLVRLAGR